VVSDSPMEFDLRMLLSVGAVFASIVAAAAIARHQIAAMLDQLHEFKALITQIDNRLDRNDQTTSNLEHRVTILSGMMSPDTLEKRFRELTALGKDIEHLKEMIQLSKRS